MDSYMQTGTLVYRSQPDDRGLKAFPLDSRGCQVKYYEEYSITSFDKLICSILSEQDNYSMEYNKLGYRLGFDVVEDHSIGSFYDEAECNIFKMMIDEVKEWGLITIEDGAVCLTRLGQLSLASEKKYKFYEATTNYLEFPRLLSCNGKKVSLYPFCEELGIQNALNNIKKTPYCEDCVDYVTKEKNDELVRNLQLQLDKHFVIFDVDFPSHPYLNIIPTALDVELYSQQDGSYTICFLKNGEYCTVLNQLVNHPINSKTKKRKVEWALYSKIMHDENATLTYDVLKPFEDIFDVGDLIPDNRIVWKDERLLKMIIGHCNADEWGSLSKYCDIHVLEGIVDDYAEHLDWGELTIRMDERFLMETYSNYPWEPQLLVARDPISEELIKCFLVNYQFVDGKDDGEWNWDEIIPILGLDFVKQHISDIPFKLSALTMELDIENYNLIKEFPEAAWDWNYISVNYPIDYLLGNIESFSGFLVMTCFMDRVFTNPDYADLGAESDALKKSIGYSIAKNGNYFNVNDKDYVWTEHVIQFFDDLGLLSWEGGTYQKGFVFNKSLTWDYDFFFKYNHKLSQGISFDHVASKVVDNKAIDDFPDFAWNWDALSRNKSVCDDASFVKSHVLYLNKAIVFLNCSSDLVEDYFAPLDADGLMMRDEAIRMKITESVSVDFIRKHIHCAWDWPSVTRRVYGSINLNVIGNEAWRDKWDWDFLSEKISLDNILEYAENYADKWNWLLVLQRFNDEALDDEDVLSKLLPIFATNKENDACWCFLSRTLPVETIFAHLDDYSGWWNWMEVLNRTSSSLLLEGGLLEKLQEVLSCCESTEQLWSIITSKFETKELIELIANHFEEKYLWDYSNLYSRQDFVAIDYLTNHLDNIRWDAFSSSDAVNKMFEKAKSKKTRSLRLRIYRDYLDNPEYHWVFSMLSHLPNVMDEPGLLQLDKNWDWSFISEHAKWINTEKESDYYFRLFVDKLSFDKLSFRTDININEEVINKYEAKNWDWDALMCNSSILFSFDFIEKHLDKPWHWDVISSRDDLSMGFLEKHKEMAWDWSVVTSKPFFEPTVAILKSIESKGGRVNWLSVSENEKLTLETIKEYRSSIIWSSLIVNNSRFLDIAGDLVPFVQEFEQFIIWDKLNKRINTKLSNDLVEAFPSKIDWRNASLSQSIDFTKDFVERYEDKWYWNELLRNLKFKKDIPECDALFVKKKKIADFLGHFDCVNRVPHIYHFTHFYNAIDVIKNRKILSRDRALELGLLRYDSAGSVVKRSNLAHPYARFYFRPCTPTQYYNEALGADSQLGEMGWGRPIIDDFTGEKTFPKIWKSKYPQALSLGLPKCPVPVFFRFDVEEVLSNIPEECYYSDRNMQSNDPHLYKVLEAPNYLCVNYLYDTMADAKERAKSNGEYNAKEIEKYKMYSQQEFLIKSEFDFSNLKSVRIICYDKEYTEILRSIFKDDPIADNIVSCYDSVEYMSLFERENRSVSLKQQMDCYSLFCDFKDDYYYRICGNNLTDIGFDFSSAKVNKESSSELIVTGVIKWRKTDSPFEVFFVDPKARTKEWLIYSNLAIPSTKSSKFILTETVRKATDSFVRDMERLPILLSRDLFYAHMVNSYHGIAHTTRVLYAAYLLCSVMNLTESESEACCIAAVIHDLGKCNDMEGAEHGYNSMELYKEKIKSLIQDELIQSRVLNAVRYHSVDDKDCPEGVKQDIVWKVLKDADALDRSRFRGKGCDKSYLRLGIYETEVGQNIIDLTSYLPGWTDGFEGNQPYTEIVDAVSKFTE